MKPIPVSQCYFSYVSHYYPSYELHGFSDASSKAYAAVVYLRSVHQNGKIEVSLVASKTRVAPIKRQSIPRLELLGATILACLVNSHQSWVRNNKSWKPYVKHRMNEIRKLTDVDSWRFSPGEKTLQTYHPV